MNSSTSSSRRPAVRIAWLTAVLAWAPGLVAGPNDFVSYPQLPGNVGSITVNDAKGHYVGRILPQKRYWVSLDHIPEFLRAAVVGVEDSRFYEHGAIDLRGIARAFVKDVFKGRLAEGGSTITQQLVKNKFLSGEKSLDRKIKEAQMAMDLEKKYTKQQILEMYFNEIYYGNGAYGLAQAARLYFDKRPEQLNENECVLLAGVPKNPGHYNPFGKPAEVLGRRETVIGRLADLNIISARQAQALRSRPIANAGAIQAQGYLSFLRAQLAERFGNDTVEQGGLEVTAAVDMTLQRQAEAALKDGVKRLAPGLQGALFCMDPYSGDVLAVVGGTDASGDTFNRAFLARRQPGSAIKPLIYAAALEKGITAASVWNDTPEGYDKGNGQTWMPRNFGNERFGSIPLRQALAHSDNVIAVKVLKTISVPYFVDYAGRLGVNLRPQNGLSLALGTDDVSLSQLVQAYTPFVNGGTRTGARTIIRVSDRQHHVLLDNPVAVFPGMSSGAAFVTAQMMRDVLTYGTAKSLRRFAARHVCAGKTGTTDDGMDAWFVGFTPQVIAGVWLGHDKPRPEGRGFTGGAVAAPIWERFMTRAVAVRPAGDFNKPDTVSAVAIDPATGLLATANCPSRQFEYFINGTAPTQVCTAHGGGEPLTPPAAAPAPAAPSTPEGQPAAAPEGQPAAPAPVPVPAPAPGAEGVPDA